MVTRHRYEKVRPTFLAASRALRAHANPEKAAFFPRFFKCGKGEYGEGDIFIGVTVPHVRAIARRFVQAPAGVVLGLLRSRFHEERLLALIIWTIQYRKGDLASRKRIYESYLKNLKSVNNWDLVDSSAPYIVGAFLRETGSNRRLLDRLAKSKRLWDRRVGIMSTFGFIRAGEFDDALRISKMLLHDKEDLIHKAVGWMLREIGKRDLRRLEVFLDRHAHEMPRTMLRYAIEKFTPSRRQHYMTDFK